MIAAIDFDHTIWDSPNNQPMLGAKEAINLMREKGIKIVIHSCNSRNYIEKSMERTGLHYDWIWDHPGKPVADIYIDDRGYHFKGWNDYEVDRMLGMLIEGNPMVKR